MNYVDLLAKIVKDSKLTHTKIAQRCEEDHGVSFDDNYISTIKNRGIPPSDDISRAIAKVCGRHEDLLVIQAYYDKSPKAFRDMFDSIIGIIKATVLMIAAQKFDETAIHIAKQRFDEMAFSEWLELDLSDISKQTEDFYNGIMDIGEFAELINGLGADEIENECSYIVPDDTMLPTLPEGAQVNTMLVTLESLKDGDYVCFPKDDIDEIYIRKIEFLGDSREKMLLKMFNSKDGKSELIETSDKRLYEKVVQVVIDFE